MTHHSHRIDPKDCPLCNPTYQPLGEAHAAIRAVLTYAELLASTSGQRPEVPAADAAWAIRHAIANALNGDKP